MSDSAPYVRPPWPKPRPPLPLWPLMAGPLLGLVVSLTAASGARGPVRFTPAFGFGSGVLLGLIVVLAMEFLRRHLTMQTGLIAIAALAVLVWLVLAYPR